MHAKPLSGSAPGLADPLHPREFLVLVALADGAKHGYAVLKRVERESDGGVRLDPANLYRMLRRLDRDGLVADAGTEPGEGGRRRLFKLTPEGHRQVKTEALRVQRLATLLRARRLLPETGRSE